MSIKHSEVPFEQILEILRDEEIVPVAPLFRLSDLQGREWEQFVLTWPKFDDERRREIMRHLVDIHEGNFIVLFDRVFSLGLGDPYAPVRLAAVDGLWLSEDSSQVRPLIRLLESDPDVGVRAAAAASLGQLYFNAICQIIPERYAPLILKALMGQLMAEDTPTPVRLSALEGASYSGDQRIPPLIAEAYESESMEFQLSAVRSMGLTGEKRWVPTLVAEMANPNPDMRVAAATAAGNIGDQGAVSELVELLDDVSLAAQIAAAYALGAIGGETAQAVLTELMQENEQPELLEAAAEALDEMEPFSMALSDLYLDQDDEDDFDDYDLD